MTPTHPTQHPHAVGCASTQVYIELRRGASYRRAWITFSHADGVTTLYREGVRLLSYRGAFTRTQVMDDLGVIVREHRAQLLAYVKAELERRITLPDGHRVHGHPHPGLNHSDNCESVFISCPTFSGVADQVNAEFRVFFTGPTIRYGMYSGALYTDGTPLHSDKDLLDGVPTASYEAVVEACVEMFNRGLAKHRRLIADAVVNAEVK